MPFLRLVPPAFCIVLLSALCMRLGLPLIMIFLLTVMLLTALVIPWTEVRRLMAGFLALESLMWGVVAIARVRVRLNYGDPWIRLVAIFVAVSAFCLWSAWLLWDSAKFDEGRNNLRLQKQ